ncbi:MAG: FeoB-associated Cys-rich membrane protein [Spirochaetaceae bacterium]
MGNIIVTLIILGITTLSIRKIVNEKRKGVKCIGCPLSASANNKSSCSC